MKIINENRVRAPAGEGHGLLQLLESLLLLHLLLLQPLYQLQLHTTLWNTLQQMSDSNMPLALSLDAADVKQQHALGFIIAAGCR